MGNYEHKRASDRLVDLIAELVTHGHTQGWWPDQLTGGHRDASGASTACPGRYLHAAIPQINQQATNQPGDTGMKPYQAEAVTRIQTALHAAGYDLGPAGIDGDPGPATASASERMADDLEQHRDYVAQITTEAANLPEPPKRAHFKVDRSIYPISSSRSSRAPSWSKR